ncbi:YceI family protein [Luteimonas sp. BDR2-5]|uniref:YceI family protein n=1 Tax=Proluteimonas luteida TaxID=2878685 RepID=UPI001E48DE20|nr:YceI family protein [Luteimonas sp. BDR2-5]MCD9029861.1 YceI family protein [Luteimonas sp. BDR2-5]
MHRPPLQFLPRLLLCLLLGAAAPAWTVPVRAAPAHYVLDPVHTRVMFAIDHAGFSKAIGTVSGSTGTLWFDPEDWSLARVEVTVPLDRLDLGDATWNRATLARNLLDADAHPVASFVSTRIEPIDADRAVVHGLLTLRGVTREVELQVVHNALRRHPLPPFRRTIGFSATAALSRSDFGMTAWRSVIGDAVELRIEVEATRARGNADDDDDGQAQDPAAPDDGDADADDVGDDGVPADGTPGTTDPRDPADLPPSAPEPQP